MSQFIVRSFFIIQGLILMSLIFFRNPVKTSGFEKFQNQKLDQSIFFIMLSFIVTIFGFKLI